MDGPPVQSLEPDAWGARREMTALEAVMWKAEADLRLRSTITAVEILDCVPDWERLLAAHDWGSRMVPRFRRRVVEPALGVGTPVWAVDPEFGLSRHLRRERLPEPGSFRALLDLAQQFASAPFDRERPPWEARLVEGLEGDRAAYLLKVNHSITDGIGGVQLLTMMHSDRREHTPKKHQPPPPEPESPEPTRLLAGQVISDLRTGASRLLRDGPAVLRRGARAVEHPEASIRDGVALALSLRRVLGPPPTEPSPLLSSRSLAWRFATHELPLAELKAAAKAAGGTVNDGFLAALLGAFRRYHEQFDVAVDSIPIAIPVSRRTAADAAGGNRIAPAYLAGPMGEADPRRRIELVHDAVLAARNEPATDAMESLAPALIRLPSFALNRVAGELVGRIDLQASNFPGLKRAAYVAGARVTHLYPFGPLPGCAAMITLVSHEETCCIGVNLDPAAITEPELFEDCLREGFDEVLNGAS